MAAGSGGPRGRSDTGMAAVCPGRPGVGRPPRRLEEQGLRCGVARAGTQRPPLTPGGGKRAPAARDPALELGRPRGTQARHSARPPGKASSGPGDATRGGPGRRGPEGDHSPASARRGFRRWAELPRWGGAGKIDLEISEPVNFSSGDHQHLVHKAAIKGNPGRLNQPFTTSSRDRPQEAIKYSYPRSRDGTNTYAVQISEDVTPPNEGINPSSTFEDTSIRKGFIVKVFVILSIQLFITAAIISIFVFCEAVKKWVLAMPWFLYALLPAVLIMIVILACCRDIRRQVPANYILLAFFTILEGLLLGSMSVLYRAEEILWATGATTAVTLALTIFALQTKWDFTLLSGVLFVVTCVLMIYGLFALVIRSYWLHLVYSALGTLLFSMYLVMDVQMMVGGRYHYEIDPEEYIFAALNIYVDIISLFIFILDLIGR
ncbi:protein lifeguard 2-like [Apodemus sylvaticus]|uniref:protein lifeguard 2-like n=1 Tax=Apodemus sylvaticus TaxID=10129 RepID=UPI002244F38A|nr:protein lifeguard 2-like [Apodemus sylvaticus]